MKRLYEMEDVGEEPMQKQPRMTFPHAFKLLAPDALSGAIIGSKGSGVQEIQQTTDTRISVADQHAKYSATNMRVVLIRAHSPEAIDQALTMIVEKIQSAVENPRGKGQDEIDLIAKGGDYKLKIVVPKAAAGAVIGTKGGNIKELCERTQCRIRVEEQKGGVTSDRCAEQVVSLLGTLEALTACAIKVNYFVQECAGQPYFQDWAHLSAGKGKWDSKGKGGGGGGGGGSGGGGSGGGAIGGGVGYGMTDSSDELLLRTMRQMPRHLTDKQTFALQASLPVDAMSGLIGKAGVGTKDINLQTGAKVTLRNDDPNCTVMIEGTLNGALSAYMLMMKRYLELEHQAPEYPAGDFAPPPSGGGESVEHHSGKGGKGETKGKSKGKGKGKGKSKGKSKGDI